MLMFSFPVNLQAKQDTKLKLSEKFKLNNTASYNESDVLGDGRTGEKPSYSALLSEYKEHGYQLAIGAEIVLDSRLAKAHAKGNAHLLTEIAGRENALVWDEDVDFFEWIIEVPQDGLYEILVEYYPLGGSGNPIQRQVMVDGNIPFEEAESIYFYRVWTDKEEPKVNNIGDEVRPGQEEEKIWKTVALTDHQGMYTDPFLFYLTKGVHSLRLIFTEEPMAIGDIIIKAPAAVPSYREVSDYYKQQGYTSTVQTVRFEAETNAVGKNDPTIRRESDGDPMTYPASSTYRKLNMIGGWRWRKGNMSITWKFSAPEAGLYKIGMRVGQWYQDGMPVFRQIAIDGKVPFSELKEYKFTYERGWQTKVLSDSGGEPYLFYLEEGEHELSMTVKMGPLVEVIESNKDDMLLLSEVIRRIIMLTGSEPDMNYEYELDKKIPDLLDNLKKLSLSMEAKVKTLNKISDGSPAMANNFLMIRDQLNKMVRNPDTIPMKLNDLNSALNNLGTWSLGLQDHPLAIDYFLAGPPDEKWENKQSNLFQKIKATWQNFINSFTKDYDSVGSIYANQIETNKVIDVWIARGKEWAEVIKEMADENFTPKTGIGVDINVLPGGAGAVDALMLSICSGKAPDAALGITSEYPVEYAIRGALADMTQFDDFDKVQKRFLPQIMIPYQYNGGVYALPETMLFKAMFYRKDILDELGIVLPDTWEDLYQHVLPVLYQHGMEFYSDRDLSTFLFQLGGEYYKDGGRTTALDTPKGYQAFRELTELFSIYNMPVNANFFNRIRQGTIPIGIGDYYTYVQLSVAAPELVGRWDIAPLPGHITEEGVINRSTGGIVEHADIILSHSIKKYDSWEFLKWWTSDDIQTKFGIEMESLMGVQARWNTANVNAFTKMPWNKQDLNVIKEQWKWANAVPVVLGGYFTSRHTENAWNRVVIGGMNVRDSLEMAIKDINRELRNKQVEYGFVNVP